MKNVDLSPAQSRAARGLLGWTQVDLARAAGLGQSTVIDFERERRAVAPASIAAMRAALGAAGVQFLDPGDSAGGPGVALQGASRPDRS